MNHPQPPAEQPLEQLEFARLLAWGSHAGLALMMLALAASLAGPLTPIVPLEQLPTLWTHPVARFLQETGIPAGWGWASMLQHGDMIGLLGIAVLAGCSALALLVLVPLYLRHGDRAMAAICLVEALVVLVAASGWLGRAH
jgi:hypothetical protein